MKPLAHQSVFLPVLVSLIALSWLTLWVWERSPYGRYLNHAGLGELDFASGLPGLLLPATLYIAGWTLMTAAMMLPTTIPLIEIFRRLTRQRPDRTPLVILLVFGYLGVWLAFGIVAHLLDFALHEAFEASAWLQANTWVLGAGPLFVAGVFQFSRLKYRCLEKCRAPLSFVMQHWHGDDTRVQALRLGAHHGAFCVGCCWALMLLMFAVGTGNVGWMLVLGAVMAIEKNMPWGRRISSPLGAALIAWSVLIALNHSWSWQA